MQLHAFGKNGLIYVDDAEKGVPYTCAGCKQEVRVRGGRFNIRHFYHVNPKKKCVFRPRSLTHLAIQQAIMKMFPKGEIALEFPMPAIKRRADAFWNKKKIVFEVQCSRITLMEVERRERDYAKVGCRVVWILSDKKFNKRLVSPAEKELRLKPCYYSSHAHGMSGYFYDQFELIQRSVRTRKSPRTKVRLSRFYLVKDQKKITPRILKSRGSIYFHGDLMHTALRYPRFRRNLVRAERFKSLIKLLTLKQRLKKWAVYRFDTLLSNSARPM